jgi:hypothetical protein
MITLSFKDLNAVQARALLDAYEAVSAQSQQAAPQQTAPTAPSMQTAPTAPTMQAAPQQAAPTTSQVEEAIRTMQPAPTMPMPAVQPMPTAPTMQVAPVAAPTTAVDVEGVPYNPDIHPTRKGVTGGKLQDGRWKMRRGVNRNDYENWRKKYVRQLQQPAEAAPMMPMMPTAPTMPMMPTAPTMQPLADPGQQAVMDKAGELSRRGLLTSAAVANIMARAGTQDNVELVNDPAKRCIAWQVMQEIEATVPA